MIRHRDARSALRHGAVAAAACVACAGPIAQSSDSFMVVTRASADVVAAPTLGRWQIAGFAGRPPADAINQLRPDWLRTSPFARRSEENARAVIYTNDVFSGDLRALQMIPSDAAVEVQFLSAAAAQIRYGPACRCPAGVIRVQTRTQE